MQRSRLDQREQWNWDYTDSNGSTPFFAYLLFTPQCLKLLAQLPASKIYLETPSYCTVHSHCNQYFRNYIYRAAVSKRTWVCSRKLQQFTLYIQGTDVAETTHREVLQLNYQRKTQKHLGCVCSETVAKNLSLSKPVLSLLYTSKAILHRLSNINNHKIECKKLSFQNTFQTVQVPGCRITSS